VQPIVLAIKMIWSQTGRMNRREDAVKRPSFSIAEMMAIIAIVAMDCLIIRATQSNVTLVYVTLGGLPMQGALVIGLLLMYRRRRRLEKPLPFLIGFEVIGWIGHVIYVLLCIQAARRIDVHLLNTLEPLLRATGFQRFSTPDWIIWTGLAMFYVTAPQWAAALFAGWLTQRWWKQTHRQTVSTHE
jgi:hypothetical protein